MQTIAKLHILADAAKYDASCASSGVKGRDSRGGKGMGSVTDFDLTALFDASKSLNEGAITVPYTPRVVRAHQVVQAARRMASVSSTSKVDTRH